MEYRLGLPQSRNHHHIIHCLDALRRDVIRNADDIPRYTTPEPNQKLTMDGFVSVEAGTKMIGLRGIMLVTDTLMKHPGIIRRFRGLCGVPRVVRTGRKLISILWLIMMHQGDRELFVFES